jgi:5'(3')-deoxyribonucleotidase
MKRRIIAIDCDDVIVATAEPTIAHYNATYGTSLQLQDIYSRDLALWGVTDDTVAIARVEQYHHSDEYRLQPPLADAAKVIKQLGKHHELHVVTGRADHLAADTLAMLEQYLPNTFASVEFTNFFGKTARSKAQVCKDIGADLLIDDHLHHAEVVAAEGIEVFLFGEYPWNQATTLPSGVTRVRNWHDIGAKLIQ